MNTRRCLVTGASRGVGAAVARAFADRGASVALAVWACASEFVHVTVSPAATVRSRGENENPEIETA